MDGQKFDFQYFEREFLNYFNTKPELIYHHNAERQLQPPNYTQPLRPITINYHGYERTPDEIVNEFLNLVPLVAKIFDLNDKTDEIMDLMPRKFAENLENKIEPRGPKVA